MQNQHFEIWSRPTHKCVAVHERVKKFLDLLDNGNGKFKASVLDAMLFLHQAWTGVSQSTIANCFCHCGFHVAETEHLDEEDTTL